MSTKDAQTTVPTEKAASKQAVKKAQGGTVAKSAKDSKSPANPSDKEIEKKTFMPKEFRFFSHQMIKDALIKKGATRVAQQTPGAIAYALTTMYKADLSDVKENATDKAKRIGLKSVFLGLSTKGATKRHARIRFVRNACMLRSPSV